jgi:hypothetical protein
MDIPVSCGSDGQVCPSYKGETAIMRCCHWFGLLVALVFSFLVGISLFNRPFDVKRGYDRIQFGMSDDDVCRAMGVEAGYYAINDIGAIRIEIVHTAGVRTPSGGIRKAWADDEGVVVVEFQDGVVFDKQFNDVGFFEEKRPMWRRAMRKLYSYLP